ncbi:25618_t:CDS:2, partial [Dentiscutata erythropus]
SQENVTISGVTIAGHFGVSFAGCLSCCHCSGGGVLVFLLPAVFRVAAVVVVNGWRFGVSFAGCLLYHLCSGGGILVFLLLAVFRIAVVVV